MKKIALILFVLLLNISAKGQTPIDLIESTFKISTLSEEVYYFGLQEGDELVFDFKELKGKPLKEVEISELGGSSMFMDLNLKRLKTKL